MPESPSPPGNRSGSAGLPSILKSILADKAARLASLKREAPQEELQRICRDLAMPRNFRAALAPAQSPRNVRGVEHRPSSTQSSARIIAEFKRRSPSRGVIRRNFDLDQIHRAYERGGADAYSVLTEEDHFDGSLDDLKALRKVAELPLLRKDFLFDPY
jgi:indole-3-glycerol phosphate synthase